MTVPGTTAEFQELQDRIDQQFQIGERVIYVPEAVCTTVTGYVWHHNTNDGPRIVSYELACGCRASRNHIVRGG